MRCWPVLVLLLALVGCSSELAPPSLPVADNASAVSPPSIRPLVITGQDVEWHCAGFKNASTCRTGFACDWVDIERSGIKTPQCCPNAEAYAHYGSSARFARCTNDTLPKNLTLTNFIAPTRSQSPAPATGKDRYVIRTQAEWDAAWAPVIEQMREYGDSFTVPVVDFSKDMVIGADMGVQPSGGHYIEITDVVETNDAVQVYVFELYPSGGATAALTHPLHVVLVPASNKTVEFLNATLPRNMSIDDLCLSRDSERACAKFDVCRWVQQRGVFWSDDPVFLCCPAQGPSQRCTYSTA